MPHIEISTYTHIYSHVHADTHIFYAILDLGVQLIEERRLCCSGLLELI